MFKERKTKFALLSLLSALVVVSTAFAGISIYAQTDDSELTTFEEEAMAAGEDVTGNATSDDNATEDGSTSIADVSSLFEGLQVCDLGTAEISGETEIASALAAAEDTTPTVSVEVMTETEVAELASNETETASAGNETSTASADCVLVGGDNATSTSNLTGTDNVTSTLDGSNAKSIASAPESDEEILVIEGQDFVPGQVVLMFTENALVGIDDVDPDGNIEAKIPMPDSGETAIAGNDTGSTGTDLRFVESGTQRTATFDFDGETLTAGAGGDTEAAESTTAPAPAPSGNATSITDTSTTTSDTNASSSSNYTVQ